MFAIQREDGRISLAEVDREVLQRAVCFRTTAFTNGKHLVRQQGVQLVTGVKSPGNQPDALGLCVGQSQQLVFQVRNAHIDRTQVFDGIRPRGPHFRATLSLKQMPAHVRLECQVMPTLNGHHLLAPDVALFQALPDNLWPVRHPARVIHGDGHAFAQRCFKQDGKTQPDRPPA